METLTATATASFIVSSGWLPTKQDKRNAHNTHSKCQSVFNEQRALAAPPALATLVAPLACCCDFLRKSENQLARNQIERRVGVATAAATSQHRQCCGRQGRRERERETVGCCHNNWQAEQQQQQQLDEAKAYAAMRVSSCRLSPWLVCLCVLHIERGRHSARQDATKGVNEDDGDSDKVAQTMCSATCQAKQIVQAATRRCLSMNVSVCVWACVSDCVCVLGR